MTTEDIIQRLLDEKHITVKEAMIMIKDLIRNRFFLQDDSISRFPTTDKPWRESTVAVMYGVQNPYNTITDRISTAESFINESIKN